MKTSKLFLTLLVFAFLASCSAPKIGEKVGGGIVFYVDKSESYVLITPENDLLIDSMPIRQMNKGWLWCYNYDPVVTSRDLGKGYSNTEAIIRSSKLNDYTIKSLGEYAALACWNLVYTDEKGHTYDDWYLPSIYELIELDSKKNELSGKVTIPIDKGFWSSTQSEISSDAAYSLRMAGKSRPVSDYERNNLNSLGGYKGSRAGVWPIRKQYYGLTFRLKASNKD